MATAKNVTVIPATLNLHTRSPKSTTSKRRVAGYARVSTDSDEQYTSYEAQVDYYTNYICSHPNWTFVEVYTDEGISALNTKKREGFNRMIADALAGKIDLIVTKSVSRFARNTVDSLTTVRKLKEKGVEVFFEKENIYTLDSKGELLITSMSSLAQEESRSLSENVAWGQRKRFSDGKVKLPYKRFLGYRKGADDLPEIIPEEAEIVRRIYSLFIRGKTPGGIAQILTQEGVMTPGGKTTWQATTIESILTNEKYKGEALLQKRFTVDFLTKKQKINEGEVPQYYVENSHPPIIDPEEWQMVQMEIKRRKALGKKYSGSSIFSSRIICGDCGEFFGSKVWHSNDKYRRTVWRCNHKFDGAHKCLTPAINENTIKEQFLLAFNAQFCDKESLLDNCRFIQSALADSSEIDAELLVLSQEMDIISGLIRNCIEENSRVEQSQAEYADRYNSYVKRYEIAQSRMKELRTIKSEREAKADAIGGFMFELMERDCPISEFDDRLFMASVDSVIIHRDGNLEFRFRHEISKKDFTP